MSRTSPPRTHVVCARGRCTDAGDLRGIDLGCALEISGTQKTIRVDKARWTGLTGDCCMWGVRGGAAVLRQFIWPQPRLGRKEDAHAHRSSSISLDGIRTKTFVDHIVAHSSFEGAQATHFPLIFSPPQLHEGPSRCRRHTLQSITTARTRSVCIDRALWR